MDIRVALLGGDELVRRGLDGMLRTLGADATIRYESPSIERVLGYTPDELVGRLVRGYSHLAVLTQHHWNTASEIMNAGQHQLVIFDTTLRDGEQSPGASMTKDEKVRIAKMLEKMRVDVIEAGFAIASQGDFEAVKAVANAVKDSRVCSLARAVPADRVERRLTQPRVRRQAEIVVRAKIEHILSIHGQPGALR